MKPAKVDTSPADGSQYFSLGDFVEIVMGQAPSSKDCNFDKKGTPFVKVGEFGELRPVIREWTTNPLRMARRTDILLCVVGATCGKINLGEDCAIGRSVAAIRPRQQALNQFYLYYFMMTLVEELRSNSVGAAQTVISKEMIGNVKIPIPSLLEQKRIVGVLDEAFEVIATAKANAEKNLQNARALFERHLQSLFTQGGKEWKTTTLSQATGGVFTGPFGSVLHKKDYITNGIPLVNPAHITDVGIEPDLRKTVSKDTALRLKNYIVREGDIVIGRRGEMGRCAVVTKIEDGWLCGTGSFFIKPSGDSDTRYLVRFLRSEGCKKRLEKIAGGAVMPNLSNTDLGNLSFDLPPLSRQKAILQEIDDLHEQTQRLETLYQQKLLALDELKKSLLRQAFSGQL